jgi:eukaryotic-like serine/threonine-protein kinase
VSHLNIGADAWTKLNSLLDQALDLPPAERSAWLDALGPEFENLKPQLRELLSRSASVETRDFLQTMPKFGAADASPGAHVGAAGDAIGHYRLVREIGSGGMGSVWLAERADGLIARPVALKLPHLLGVPRAGLAERMAREREILATLDHRNIARLLDAGVTAGGQPYLALEYVEGLPIDRFCADIDGGAPLDIAARLKLFRQVADAVAYAHGKLVVHRDLKPANILVTANGGVKLLDFGIAKLLDEGKAAETHLTQLSGRALTPDYASPEQILGEPLTVASDVYSLGVILFELLAGSRPYRLKRDSRGALEDAIVDGEVPRTSQTAPAALRRQLQGDLDTIVAKALKRKPQERYATVNALADDVTRHLEQRPVLARPDSRWYTLGKFVARNRWPVAAVGATSVAVVGTAAFALLQMIEAKTQRDLAQKQSQRMELTNDFLSRVLDDAGGSGKPLSLAESLDRTTALMESRYESDETVFANMLYQAALRYAVIGQVDRQQRLLERVAASGRKLGDADILASAQCSAVEPDLNSNQESAKKRMAEVDALIASGRLFSQSTQWVCERARALLLEAAGERKSAIARLERTLARQPGTTPMPLMTRVALLGDLGYLKFKDDDVAGCLASTDEAIQLLDKSGRGESMSMVVHLINHAAVLSLAGELRAASEEQQRAYAMVGRFESDGKAPVGFGGHLANTYMRLARYEEALQLAAQDSERARSLGNARVGATSDLIAARALGRLGRFEEAAATLNRAEAALRVNEKANGRMLNEVTLTRAEHFLLRGDTARARVIVDEVLRRMEYPQKKTSPGLASALYTGIRVLLAQGDAATAEPWTADALAFELKKVRKPEDSANYGQALLHRAEALTALGRQAEALELAEDAAVSLANGFTPEHPDTVRARALAGRLRQANAVAQS